MPIRKKIREKYGFGCIFCGCVFFEYHHFNPQFKDAKFHNPNNIVPLCPTCHDKYHNKLISQNKFNDFLSKPYAMINGAANYKMDTHGSSTQINLGTNRLISTSKKDEIYIVNDTRPVIWTEYDQNLEQFFICVNMKFDDQYFIIRRNEIIVPTNNFDVTTSGNNLTLFYKGNKKLEICLNAEFLFGINFCNYSYEGININIDSNTNKGIGFMDLGNMCRFSGCSFVDMGLIKHTNDIKLLFSNGKTRLSIIHDYQDKELGELVMGYLDGKLSFTLTERYDVFVGKVINDKCYNKYDDFIGFLVGGYIFSDTNEFPDGRPKYAKLHNRDNFGKLIYDVSRNIFNS